MPETPEKASAKIETYINTAGVPLKHSGIFLFSTNYKGKSGAYTYAYRLGYAEGCAVIYKRYGKHKGIECRHAETPYGSLFGLENSLQQNEHKNIQNAYHKQENKRMLYFAESTYKRYLLKQYTKNTAECRKECDKRREREKLLRLRRR